MYGLVSDHNHSTGWDWICSYYFHSSSLPILLFILQYPCLSQLNLCWMVMSFPLFTAYKSVLQFNLQCSYIYTSCYINVLTIFTWNYFLFSSFLFSSYSFLFRLWLKFCRHGFNKFIGLNNTLILNAHIYWHWTSNEFVKTSLGFTVRVLSNSWCMFKIN